MLPGKKYLDAEGRTIAVYPSPILAWSQDVNTGSHLGLFPFDETVDGTATKKPIYSPGNLICVAKELAGKSNAVIFDAIAPEHWADGTIDFYHVRLVHDDSIADIALKQIFHQGDKLYDEGVYGKATGPHIHMEVGRGKYPGRLRLNTAGNYALISSVEPWKVFAVNDTQILQGFGHPWKELKETPFTITPTNGPFAVTRITDHSYRANASVKAAELGKLTMGVKYPILGISSVFDALNWAQLVVDGKVVYASTFYLTITEPTQEVIKEVVKEVIKEVEVIKTVDNAIDETMTLSNGIVVTLKRPEGAPK